MTSSHVQCTNDIRLAFAWAELELGTVSDVVRSPLSCDAATTPTTVIAIQMAMTMALRLITKRIHRSNTFVAYCSSSKSLKESRDPRLRVLIT